MTTSSRSAPSARIRGFTLTEMAVVFTIVALLLASAMYTLSAQTENRNLADTQRRIEDALYEHDAVAEATVIGIPDEYRGEAPKAFVRLKEGKEATAAELLQFLRGKLSKIELPAEIEFRGELPKTMVGKLSKKELRTEAKS